MIVVYARSRWADSASWTWRTVWGSPEDQRWSITARSSSPRRVNLAISVHLLRAVNQGYYGVTTLRRIERTRTTSSAARNVPAMVTAPGPGLVSRVTGGSSLET